MKDPDKPQQIIEAAIRVFARKGYYNSRVSDIAREAGIASRHHLSLLQDQGRHPRHALPREDGGVRRASAARAIAGEPDPVAKVRPAGRLHFRMLEQDPELAEVVQVELRQGQKFFRGASAQEVVGLLRADRLRPRGGRGGRGASAPTCR